MEGIIKEGSSEFDPGVDRVDLPWDRGLVAGDWEWRADIRLAGVRTGVSRGVFEEALVTLEGSGVATSSCSSASWSFAAPSGTSGSFSLSASDSNSDMEPIDAPPSDSYSASPHESPRLPRSFCDRATFICWNRNRNDVMRKVGNRGLDCAKLEGGEK